jgi:hypothetical protein
LKQGENLTQTALLYTNNVYAILSLFLLLTLRGFLLKQGERLTQTALLYKNNACATDLPFLKGSTPEGGKGLNKKLQTKHRDYTRRVLIPVEKTAKPEETLSRLYIC